MVHIDESRTACKYTPGRQGARVDKIVVLHWGSDGQSHDGVVDWFCNPAKGAQTSAHFVVSAGRVHCIVSPTDTAWHAGDWTANTTSIGIELRPEATAADYTTAAELIRWLRTQYGDLPLRLHKDFTATACPGRWDLARLDREARGGTMTGMSPVPTGTDVTQEYGTNPGGYNPAGGHTGRDYGTWTGTYTVSRAAGKVLWADWCHKLPGGTYGWADRWFFDLAYGGIIVVLQHDDGLITTYSHLHSTHLNPGDRVGRGEIVGETGNTGSATSGDHLHYEALPLAPNWNNGTYGRVPPGPYITEPYTSVTTQSGTVVATPGASTGSGAAPTTIDPLEEIMGWFSSKKDFLDSVALAVIDYKFSNNGRGPTGKKQWIWLGKVLSEWHELVKRVTQLEETIPATTVGYDVTRRGDGPQSGGPVNLATVLAYEQDNQVADRATMQQILAQQELILQHLGITTTENGA